MKLEEMPMPLLKQLIENQQQAIRKAERDLEEMGELLAQSLWEFHRRVNDLPKGPP